MAKTFPETVSFRSGVVHSAKKSYVLAEDSEVMDEGAPHTALLTWDKGKWLHHLLDWVANSACVRRDPVQQVVITGEDGEYLVGGGGGDLIEGKIPVHAGPRKKRGPLRSVRAIGGVPYVVGMGGVVFRQEQPDQWVRVDSGIPPSQNLESIAGISDKDMYAVGRKGAIWRCQDGVWQKIDSPTKVILTSVCCGHDKQAYACGQDGTLLRGKKGKWKAINQKETDADLWDVEWFKDKLYVSTMTAVYRLEGNKLQYVFGKEQPETAYHLSSSGSVLWSIGGKDIMAFNGKTWKRIE
ncbi:hypothetical protein ACFL6C_02280 [Myxococcota bacterium]